MPRRRRTPGDAHTQLATRGTVEGKQNATLTDMQEENVKPGITTSQESGQAKRAGMKTTSES